MPYQRLAISGNHLIAARESSIDSFSLQDGSLSYTWCCPFLGEDSKDKSKIEPHEFPLRSGIHISEVEPEYTHKLESGPSPAKKRRLSSTAPPTGLGESKQAKTRNTKFDSGRIGLGAPFLIALAVTKDDQYVVTVTGEDKSVRVLKQTYMTGKEGQSFLKQISVR